MVEDPKKVVREIVAQLGKREAQSVLEAQKVNKSTAEKLAGGRYSSEVGFLLAQKIYRAHEIVQRKQSA